MWDGAAMDAVDWSRLFHAYGMAEDTPGHLRHLVDDDASLREAAIEHLYAAVLHQGTIYSVTPSAVRVLIELLDEPALRQSLGDEESTLAAVLGFLGCVGESTVEAGVPDDVPSPYEDELTELFHQLRDDDSGEDEGKGWSSHLIGVLMVQAVHSLRELADAVLSAVRPFLSDSAADVRREAMNVAAQWGALQSGDGRDAADVLRHRLDACEDRDERAGLVLSLGKMGDDVSHSLGDPDEAVRACAALFVHGERADAELVAALTRPEQVDTWFAQRPAALPMHARFALLAELIARRPRLEDILPAALAVIAHSTAMTADFEWGPVLGLAFPEAAAAFRPGVRPPLPARPTGAQRAVLEALVANLTLWDSRNGNANLARMRVGLPDLRAKVVEYLHDAPA